MEKKVLTKDSILSSKDLKRECVEVPEWGGSVWVQELTGSQRDSVEKDFAAAQQNGAALVNIRARIATMTCVDDAGNLLFTPADSGKLGGKSAAALDRIFDTARRLSGMGLPAVEEEMGNSPETLSGGSSSGSVSDSGALTPTSLSGD